MVSRAPQHRTPKEVPGWRKLPGPSRRYENVTTHRTIARRAYVDKQAQALGYRDWAEYQRISKYAGGLGGMRSDAALEVSSTLNRAVAVGELDASERDKFIREHASILRDIRAHPDNMSAGGPLARWLEALGIREQHATYAVGESPHGIRQTMGR